MRFLALSTQMADFKDLLYFIYIYEYMKVSLQLAKAKKYAPRKYAVKSTVNIDSK